MPEVVKPPEKPEDIKTVEELYLTGLRLDQFYNPKLAPDIYYEEALRRDPGNYRVNIALGILFCKRLMFEKAGEHLTKAVKRATKDYTMPKDGEAFYYLGIALKAQGKYDEAYKYFHKAIWSIAWQAQAYYELAELACLKGDLTKALEFSDRSISMNTQNTKALNLKVVILRSMGKLKDAENLALSVFNINPLDFWTGNEEYLAKKTMGMNYEAQKSLDILNRKMNNYVQSYLELAIDYGNCGFFDDAIEVLTRFVVNTEEKDKL